MEKAINVKEAATILGISGKFLYRLVAEGKVPHFRVGAAVRFLPSQLELFMKGQWKPKPTRARGRRVKDYGYVEQLIGRGPSLH